MNVNTKEGNSVEILEYNVEVLVIVVDVRKSYNQYVLVSDTKLFGCSLIVYFIYMEPLA